MQALWTKLPLIELADLAGAPPNDWREMLSHSLTDSWWDQFDYLSDDSVISAPALFVNSWYDYGVADSLYQFNHFQEHALSKKASNNQFIIISPTVHCRSETATENTVVGERPMGDARFPYFENYLRWFDHWLKDNQDGDFDMPHVQYYFMGKNEWRSADSWPVPGTQFTPFFLSSGGSANSSGGSGVLSMDRREGQPFGKYTYDPATPVASVGGPICCTGDPRQPAGAFDQRAVEMRRDVLVYTTEPLGEGVEVTGPIEVTLYVSSSAPDTDFVAKLVDVYPDGRAFNVQEGMLRARYREGFQNVSMMEPGEVYTLHINLHATGNYFAAGHQIRLEISSSSFPRFDRNLNTGGDNFRATDWAVAQNTVHHSARYPSNILLPIIPQSGKGVSPEPGYPGEH